MLVDVRAGVLEVGGKNFAADDTGAGHHFGLFRDEHCPIFLGRLLGVDEHNLVVRSVHVGSEDELVLEVVNHVGVIFEPLDEGQELGFYRFEIFIVQLVAIGPFGNGQEHVALIFRDIRVIVAAGIGRVFVDQLVLALGSPELVKVDFLILVGRGEFLAFRRFFEPGIIKAVTLPGGAAELGPLDAVLELLAGLHLHDPHLRPVRPTLRPRIGGIAVIVRESGQESPGGSVRRKSVGVEEDPGFAVQALLDVDDALVLEAVVLHEEIILSDSEGRRIAGIIVDLGQPGADPLPGLDRALHRIGGVADHVSYAPAADLLAEGDLGQVIESDLVLGLHPFRRRLGLVVLEPAIRVGDFCAEIIIHHVALLGNAVGDRRLFSLAAEGQQGNQEDRDQDVKLLSSHFSLLSVHG